MKHPLYKKFTFELASAFTAIFGVVVWLAYLQYQSASLISQNILRFEKTLKDSPLVSYKQLVSNSFDDYSRTLEMNLLSTIVCVFLAIVFVYYRWINLKKSYVAEKTAHEAIVSTLQTKNELREVNKEESAVQNQVFELLAYLGHEIRTPVSALVGYLDAARRLTDGGSRRVIDKAKETAQTLVDNLGVFLESSRFFSGKVTLQEERIAINSLISEVSNVVYLMAEKKGLELYLDIAPNVNSIVYADSLRIKQVLINLINNAIKFTSQGYVKLQVDQALISDEELELVFTIKDTGIGITNEQSKTLFQRFEQVEGQFVKEYGGSGLGLFICKNIADLMKGALSIQPRKHKGTKSIFRAPVKTMQRSTPVRSMVKNGTILLILTPNAEQVNVLRHGLEDLYGQFHAHSSFDVLDEMELDFNMALDVVVSVELLYSLSNKSHAVYRQFKSNFKTVCEIGLVSFSNQEKHIKDLKDFGISSYLIKPILAQDVFSRLNGLAQEELFSAAALNLTQQQSNSIAGKRVLLVEDTESLREMTADSLQCFGAQVDCASNGAEAASMALNPLNKYDFVLMDIQMPFLDGIQAALRIRQHFDRKHLPIFALTSHSLEHEIQKCYSAGMNNYLCKPIDINRLCEFFLKEESQQQNPVKDLSKGDYKIDMVLDSVGAIKRYAGRLELLMKAYEIFIGEANFYLSKISSMPSNSKEMSDLVHKIGGVGGMIGAERLSHACDFFTRMLHDNPNELSCLETIRSELSAVLTQTKLEVEKQLSSSN